MTETALIYRRGNGFKVADIHHAPQANRVAPVILTN